jgi:hypothetical protein
VNVEGQSFAPSMAPPLGHHSDELLQEMPAMTPEKIAALRSSAVVA